MDTQRALAERYIRARVKQCDKRIASSTANTLDLAQAEGLKRFLGLMTVTPQNMSIIACGQLLRESKTYSPMADIVTESYVGGVPNPQLVTETRPASKLWETAKTPGERREALAEDGPLREGKSCRLRGRLELPSGSQPQRFTMPGGAPLEYLVEERPDLLKWLGTSDCSVSGAWPTSRGSLDIMSQGTDGVGHSGDLRRALKAGWESLKLERMPQPTIDAVDSVRVNPTAFPGIVSSRLGKNRKQVFGVSAEIAKRHYRAAKDKFTPDLSFWACGGREKPNQLKSPGDLLKSRLVLMPETPSSLLESAFSQPFTEMLKKAQGDIMIGCTMTDQGFERVLADFKLDEHVKAFDWSNFDAHVGESLIVASFAIVRACFFGDDRWLDNLFLRFISHFLVKQVVTPGGWLYTIACGVPSGSPFTSIIDSLANWLVLVDMEIAIGGPGSVKRNARRTYGDDFLQAIRDDPPTKDEYVELALFRWGFVAKPSAAQEGPLSTTECRSSLPFLSYRFPCGLPARPIEDAIKLALLPKKARFTYGQQWQRVVFGPLRTF